MRINNAELISKFIKNPHFRHEYSWCYLFHDNKLWNLIMRIKHIKHNYSISDTMCWSDRITRQILPNVLKELKIKDNITKISYNNNRNNFDVILTINDTVIDINNLTYDFEKNTYNMDSVYLSNVIKNMRGVQSRFAIYNPILHAYDFDIDSVLSHHQFYSSFYIIGEGIDTGNRIDIEKIINDVNDGYFNVFHIYNPFSTSILEMNVCLELDRL